MVPLQYNLKTPQSRFRSESSINDNDDAEYLEYRNDVRFLQCDAITSSGGSVA